MKIDSQLALKKKINSVIALHSSGQMEKALNAVEALLQVNPNEALLHDISGFCYAGLGQFNNAILRYEEALCIKPNYAEVLNNLGITLQNLSKPEEAIKS